MPNIEIKAPCPNPTHAIAIARSLGARYEGLDHQVDTYFKTQAGRLKLRESSLSGTLLIPYLRSDTSGPRKSLYTLLTAADPHLAKTLLSQTLGVETVIEKDREIFHFENVRIHIDTVKNLGSFLEFEAVYSDDSPESVAREESKVRHLMDAFGIRPAELIAGSYRDRG